MKHFFETRKPYNLPDKDGFFGDFGGVFVPDNLKPILKQLEADFYEAWNNEKFLEDLYSFMKSYVGRPTPLYYAERLSKHFGGGKIYLKREDLNHTGAHKINNALGQVLLAKHSGKKRIIAETGAGSHGVASATAAALFGMECIIFMGEEDIKRQHSNVVRMQTLGAEVRAVSRGSKTLAEAIDVALEYWAENQDDTYYLIGSAVGPHPYPLIVRSFQSVIGCEIRHQMLEQTGKLPDYIVGCIGGGSNLIGAIYSFINTPVKLIGIEAGGKGLKSGQNCASLELGKEGILHGFKNMILQDENGNIKEAYSISAGLDYPGVGPEHCYLHKNNLAEYVSVTDDEAVEAFKLLSRLEGIIPAIESSHALGYLPKLAPKLSKDETIVISLSGRGDKDVDRLLGC